MDNPDHRAPLPEPVAERSAPSRWQGVGRIDSDQHGGSMLPEAMRWLWSDG